jgi:GTP-binding protein
MLQSLSDKITSHGGSRHTLQAVITKVDSVPMAELPAQLKRMREEIFKAAPVCLPPLLTSVVQHPFIGIEEVRRNILDACGLLPTKKP